MDLHLNIYGTGNDLDKCKKYSEQLGIADKITWHGWTENLWEEIKERPTALIMTSKYEGLPMIMLESIARGIPVVSTKFAGYEDILKDGENSYTYSQGDINGLIRAMTDVANTSLSPECIKKSIENYYPEKYFKKLKESLEYFENNNL
ncbi:glycosyltransferase [Ligilactobacillus salivarius]